MSDTFYHINQQENHFMLALKNIPNHVGTRYLIFKRELKLLALLHLCLFDLDVSSVSRRSFCF